MSQAALLFPKPFIGPIILDMLESEHYSLTSKISEKPIANSKNVSDSVSVQPKTVHLSGFVSSIDPTLPRKLALTKLQTIPLTLEMIMKHPTLTTIVITHYFILLGYVIENLDYSINTQELLLHLTLSLRKIDLLPHKGSSASTWKLGNINHNSVPNPSSLP